MNERIKEFDDSAHFYADEHWLRGPKWHEFYIEKFAELIIKECADILMKPEYVMNHPEELTDYNRGWVNGRLLGIEHIKEHFGVEE
jgi:hypothetical protein